MPIYGMKTPRATFVAICTGMPHSFGVEAVADKGAYRVSAYYSFLPDWAKESADRVYEDIVIEYRFLAGDDADYSGMTFYLGYMRGIM